MTETLTLQPDGTAGKDCVINRDLPTSPSDNIALNVGEHNAAVQLLRGLIQFDLSSIPAGSAIISATLSLWLNVENSSNSRTMRLFRSKRDWVESQATWNQYSTGNNWQTAGGFGANDAEQTDVGSRSFSASESNGEKQFTLTPGGIQGMITGGGFTNRGWLIKVDTENADQYRFRSSDYTTASERPKIVIVYSLPTGGGSRFWF